MDLAKAFNLIPRYPAAILLHRLGMPWWCLSFWLKSLSNMSRVPIIDGVMGIPISSTTGVPEGDVWSVLAMIAVSSMFYFKNLSPQVSPFSYADNWSWIAKSVRENFLAWIKTLQLVSALKMVISLSKSWLWSTSSKVWGDLKNVNLLFPDGSTSVPILEHAKDLGEIVQYNKSCFSKPITERVDEAISRMERIKNLPLSITSKAAKIQGGIWSFGLYAADTHFIGMHHFKRLRRAAANALLGAYHHINPYLACLCLSKHIQDPLLYVVTVALRSVRRLFTIQKPLAHDFVKRTESFDACVTYGPASSLSKYLEKMGLWMTKEALVCSEDGLVCDVQFSSGKEIKLAMSRYWSKFVFSAVIDRKGIPNDEVNVSVQLSVFSSLTDAEQKLTALNVTGGFQTNAIKKKWNEDVEVQCNFCEQFDNRAHRLLTYTATSVTRDQHMDAVGILTNEYPDWQYLPLATHVEDTNVFLMAMQAIKLPKPDPAMIVHATHHIYYTDGGCIFPQIADARISSWAVVRDFALGEEHALAMTKNAIDLSKPCPLMRCLEMGLTQGRQTISRGELCAIIVACESASLDDQLQVLDLYTDSQYAINVIHFICMGHKWGYKIANFDLVLRLSQVWDTRKFRAHKVKSHLDWTAQTSLSYARKIMGNFVADRLATLALKRCPRWMKQMSEAIASHRNHQKEKFQKVFRYMVDLSKQRRKLETEKTVPQHQSQSAASCRNLMCDDAVEIFYRYHIVNGLQVSLDFYDSPNLQGSLQGVNLARLILKWAESITWTWPTPDHNWGPQQDLAAAMSWGVSWFELFINFAITTGCFMPVRVAGSLEHVQFTEYFSETARILPSDRRSAMNQATSFQSACRCVESILRVKLFPDFVSKGGKAIHRYGFTGRLLVSCPGLCCSVKTKLSKLFSNTFEHLQTKRSCGSLWTE